LRRTTVLTALTLSTTALIAPLVAYADASADDASAAREVSRATAKADPHGRARLMYRFKDARIKESSGIETSTRFRTITYTHNDSGDTSRFFAIGGHGGTVAVFTLRGATHYDWEDMSAGPRHTLWFGDIGSNASNRGSISVYRVKEPTRLKSRAIRYTRFKFQYSDGQSHNAETLLVNPRSGALMVVTKQLSGAAFYRAKPPFKKTGVTTLKRVGPAPGPGVVTAGSYSPDGKRFVIRSYGRAYFYKKVGARPYVMGIPNGGESLAYARYRSGIVVGQEGVHAPVYRVRRP
jgi:hypothetical protein